MHRTCIQIQVQLPNNYELYIITQNKAELIIL